MPLEEHLEKRQANAAIERKRVGKEVISHSPPSLCGESPPSLCGEKAAKRICSRRSLEFVERKGAFDIYQANVESYGFLGAGLLTLIQSNILHHLNDSNILYGAVCIEIEAVKENGVAQETGPSAGDLLCIQSGDTWKLLASFEETRIRSIYITCLVYDIILTLMYSLLELR